MDSCFADHCRIQTKTLSQPLPINAVDGQPLAANHIARLTEDNYRYSYGAVGFLIISVAFLNLILGYPWLTPHNPFIFWTDGRIIQWGTTC